MAGAFEGATAIPSDTLGDQVLNDLDLLQLGMLARADILTSDVVQLVLSFVAAVARQVEERVVHCLGHQRKGLAISHGGGGCKHGQHGRCGQKSLHEVLPWIVKSGGLLAPTVANLLQKYG